MVIISALDAAVSSNVSLLLFCNSIAKTARGIPVLFLARVRVWGQFAEPPLSINLTLVPVPVSGGNSRRFRVIEIRQLVRRRDSLVLAK